MQMEVSLQYTAQDAAAAIKVANKHMDGLHQTRTILLKAIAKQVPY
jgi:hypothetical protein